MSEELLSQFRIERLMAAIRKLDEGNQTAFGRRLGYKDGGMVRQMLSGKRPVTEKTIRKIESHRGMEGWFDISSPELRLVALNRHQINEEGDDLGEIIKQQDEIDSALIKIPQFKAAGAMGHGLDLPDQPGLIKNLSVTWEWLDKNVRSYSAKNNLCVVTGFGDSMRPLFNPGDPLLLDRGVTTVEIDAVYFFRIGEEGFIKRLQRIPGNGLVAISENKSYKEWIITKDMDFEVFGRILKAWRSEDL